MSGSTSPGRIVTDTVLVSEERWRLSEAFTRISSKIFTRAGWVIKSVGEGFIVVVIVVVSKVGTYWLGSRRGEVEPTYIPGRRRTCSKGVFLEYVSSIVAAIVVDADASDGTCDGTCDATVLLDRRLAIQLAVQLAVLSLLAVSLLAVSLR